LSHAPSQGSLFQQVLNKPLCAGPVPCPRNIRMLDAAPALIRYGVTVWLGYAPGAMGILDGEGVGEDN
jgi:hypothetical protein